MTAKEKKAIANPTKWTALEFIEKAIRANRSEGYKGLLINPLISGINAEIARGTECRIANPEAILAATASVSYKKAGQTITQNYTGARALVQILAQQKKLSLLPVKFAKGGSVVVYIAGDLSTGSSKATEEFLSNIK